MLLNPFVSVKPAVKKIIQTFLAFRCEFYFAEGGLWQLHFGLLVVQYQRLEPAGLNCIVHASYHVLYLLFLDGWILG